MIEYEVTKVKYLQKFVTIMNNPLNFCKSSPNNEVNFGKEMLNDSHCIEIVFKKKGVYVPYIYTYYTYIQDYTRIFEYLCYNIHIYTVYILLINLDLNLEKYLIII